MCSCANSRAQPATLSFSNLSKQFLDFPSIPPPKALYCSDGGWLLGHFPGHFWQDGSEVWNIPLPYGLHSLIGSNAR